MNPVQPPPVPPHQPESSLQNVVPVLAASGISMGSVLAMTLEDLESAVANGARFVRFPYCFSVIILSFRRAFVHYLPPGVSGGGPAWAAAAISGTVGWWGFPWGIIFSIGSLFTNALGGSDITRDIMTSLTTPQRAGQLLAMRPPVKAGAGIWGLRAFLLLIVLTPLLALGYGVLANPGGR